MESILEEQRKLHEERERLEEAMVKEKILKKNSVSNALRKKTANNSNIFFPPCRFVNVLIVSTVRHSCCSVLWTVQSNL